MSAAIRIEHEGAVLEIPKETVIRNFVESFQRTPIELPALRRNDIPRIGEFWHGEGGINAGWMRGVNGHPDYFLIIAPGDAGYIDAICYGGHGEDEPGAKCEFDGLANTIALCESKHDHPAAQWARERVIDGRKDYYLLSRRENALAYANVPELFAKKWHLTSTQYSADHAWVQDFGGGTQNYGSKSDEFAARVGRRLIYSFIE